MGGGVNGGSVHVNNWNPLTNVSYNNATIPSSSGGVNKNLEIRTDMRRLLTEILVDKLDLGLADIYRVFPGYGIPANPYQGLGLIS